MVGVEGVGEVTAVGVGVTDMKVGDIVAYSCQPLGSYAEEHILPALQLVPLPPSIHPIVGASIMSKGLTTRYLLQQCFKVCVYVYCSSNGRVHLASTPHNINIIHL